MFIACMAAHNILLYIQVHQVHVGYRSTDRGTCVLIGKWHCYCTGEEIYGTYVYLSDKMFSNSLQNSEPVFMYLCSSSNPVPTLEDERERERERGTYICTQLLSTTILNSLHFLTDVSIMLSHCSRATELELSKHISSDSWFTYPRNARLPDSSTQTRVTQKFLK